MTTEDLIRDASILLACGESERDVQEAMMSCTRKPADEVHLIVVAARLLAKYAASCGYDSESRITQTQRT